MNQEITKKLYAIVMRNGIELWVDEDFAKRFQGALSKITSHTFIPFEGRTINTADVSGVFTAEDMADFSRRKNGQNKCSYGNWHNKADRCECWRQHEKSFSEKYAKFL